MNNTQQDTGKTISTYDHVLKYMGLLGGVQCLKVLANLFCNKLSSVILGTTGMGLNAIYANISELINASTNLGLSTSSVRNISELYEKGDRNEISDYVCVVRTWCVWTAVAGMLLCILLSPLFCYMFFNSDYSHVGEICLLSLLVLSLPLEASECSILKAMRQLKTISMVEVLGALSALFTTIPLYMVMGLQGIVLALVLSGWAVVLIHLYFTTKLYPWRIRPFSMDVFYRGLGLVKIGVPFVGAAVLGTVTMSFVYGMIDDINEVGLFKAGYAMMVVYVGMVYVALDTDYYPRLSSINKDQKLMNVVINQQVDSCLMVITPLLIMMVMTMPQIVNLLYSKEFVPVAPMAILSAFYMFFLGFARPVEYITLAKGESHIYLVVEIIYSIIMVGMVFLGYSNWGLNGVGIALSATSMLNAVVVYIFFAKKYDFIIDTRTIKLALAEFVLLLTSVSSVMIYDAKWWIKYLVGVICVAISLLLAWKQMKGQKQIKSA